VSANVARNLDPVAGCCLHVQVGNDYIDRHGFQDGERFCGIFGLQHLEAALAKDLADH
jgi:hypothetical protein